MRIIVATNNEGKLEEIREIFSNYDIVSIKEAGFDLEVDEDENTFARNAMKKAKACAKLTGELCLADDSGLAIEYFKGWPGVKTNRWMEGTDRDRNIAIVKIMEELPKEERLANWVTAIAAVDRVGNSYVATNSVTGFISTSLRGKNGFGFDEIFELENGKTLAELSSKEKNEIGARKKALEQVRNYLDS